MWVLFESVLDPKIYIQDQKYGKDPTLGKDISATIGSWNKNWVSRIIYATSSFISARPNSIYSKLNRYTAGIPKKCTTSLSPQVILFIYEQLYMNMITWELRLVSIFWISFGFKNLYTAPKIRQGSNFQQGYLRDYWELE